MRVGIDIGGTNIAFGLLTERFDIISRRLIPFPRHLLEEEMPNTAILGSGGTKPEKYKKAQNTEADEIAVDYPNARQLVKLIKTIVYEMCEEAGSSFDAIETIGICLPGSIDRTGQIVINAHNIGFHNVPFKRITECMLGKKILMRNDADAATLAEYRLGSLKGVSTAMLLTLGTGVGGGIIMNGRLFRGGMGNGIEPGHMRLNNRGARCTCGQTGCVETLCSATRLTNEAKKLYKNGNAALRESGVEPDASALAECAQRGDTECLKVWNGYLSDLSDALASIIDLLDPQVIAIGGGVSNAGDFLISPLSRMAVERSFFDNAARIVKASLGNDAGMIGAALDED